MLNLSTKRILLLDSNPAIHEDFNKIWGADSEDTRVIEVETSSLYSKLKQKKLQQTYIIDSAYTGDEAIDYLKQAKANQQAYTVAFIDLPSRLNWDAITTIKRLWEIDSDLQVVLCISFSVYTWQDISEKLQRSDHFLIVNKPFDVVEIRQLVFYLSRKEEINKTIQEKINALNLKINFQNTHDTLTGLGNYLLLKESVLNALVNGDKRGSWVGMTLFSVDNLKEINILFGSSTGDRFIQLVAEKCKTIFSEPDILMRYGNDEFIAILTSDVNEENIMAKLSQLQAEFLAPLKMEAHSIIVSIHAGIAIYPRDGQDLNSLIKNAEVALSFSKTHGQKKIQFYNKLYQDVVTRRAELMISLPNALSNKQFVLHYQPLVKSDSSQILGVEALLRWQHPQFGLLYPQEFIPLAEEIGLISTIGEWVLKTACARVKKWQKTICPELTIAVNISADQLSQPNFERLVQKILKKTELQSRYLELEIIANPILMNDPDILQRMHQLKESGISFSLDNFGVGHANLNYLHHFPYDKIKIDRIFVKNISTDKKENKEIEAILMLAINMGIRVVAEGVETPEQVEFLFNHQGEQMQGFYFSPPLNEEACTILLSKQNISVVP